MGKGGFGKLSQGATKFLFSNAQKNRIKTEKENWQKEAKNLFVEAAGLFVAALLGGLGSCVVTKGCEFKSPIESFP